MPEIRMPKLTDSMTDGVVLRWLRADGEQVAAGEDIVEIETDKTSVDFPASSAGVLHHLAGEGDTVVVGGVIGRIDGALDPATA